MKTEIIIKFMNFSNNIYSLKMDNYDYYGKFKYLL